MLGDYAKTLGGVSDLRANKGRFDRAAEVTALPRSLSKSIFPPHFFRQSRLFLLAVGEMILSVFTRDAEPENPQHVFHLAAN